MEPDLPDPQLVRACLTAALRSAPLTSGTCRIWFMMAQPFILLFTPGILWGGIVYGTLPVSCCETPLTTLRTAQGESPQRRSPLPPC